MKGEIKWTNISVDLVVIFTILRWEILTAELHPEQLLKIFRMTGPARYAASAKICLRKYNDGENGFGKIKCFVYSARKLLAVKAVLSREYAVKHRRGQLSRTFLSMRQRELLQ